MIMRIIALTVFLLICALVVPAYGQPSPLPPVNGEPAIMETGYFNLIVDPAEYPGAGDDETEDIRFLSLLVAHGLVHGIDWHRVGSGNKIKIDERLYAIVRDMSLDETTKFDGCYRYSYSYQYASREMDVSKVGKSIEAVGESEKENMADAWDEARELAFIDAVEKALARKYTDNQLAIPNEVRGLIPTYEILYDDYNFTDKVYRFKIKAWVSFEPRKKRL